MPKRDAIVPGLSGSGAVKTMKDNSPKDDAECLLICD
jgi:hypothetical protein